MFETVAPELSARPSRKVFYEALPFSLGVHGVVVFCAILIGIWDITFPLHSPAQAMAFSIAELPAPPPPPPPPPPPAKAAPVELPPVRELKYEEIVAPTVIPDVTPIGPQEVVQTAAEGVDDPEEGANGLGIVGGMEGGVTGGEVGGTLGGVVGGVVQRVEVERDRPLPMRALSQVYPSYPEKARRQYIEDELIVRYIIGKDGRVREVIVLSPPKNEIFTDATVRAIRSWRFRPLVKDGERQEVAHELTVYYRLEPRT